MSRSEKTTLKAHAIICTSCQFKANDGSESSLEVALNFRAELKAQAFERFGKPNCRVTAATCLGRCEEGIAAVVYPEGRWLVDLRPQDHEIVLQAMQDQIND